MMDGLWLIVGFVLGIIFTLITWWYTRPNKKVDDCRLLHIFSGPPTKISEYASSYFMYWVYRVNDCDFRIDWGHNYLGGNIPINLKGLWDMGLAEALMFTHFPKVMVYRQSEIDTSEEEKVE